MSTKAALKAAKAALDEENYEVAATQAHQVLAADGNNYFAKLFLGRALEKQQFLEDAARAYQSAAELKPEDNQAWLGLCSLYEAQGSAKVDEFRQASVRVAENYAKAEDKHRCQTTVDKLVAFSKQHGTRSQYKRALEVLLPGSVLYDLLEGRILHPAQTYARLAEITEEEEDQFIKQEIAARRTRIGARVGQVTADVKREVFGQSNLEQLYQEIINWSSDDEVRRQYEEKLLERGCEILVNLPAEQKGPKLDQVLTLAEGMVIIHHQFQAAWDLVIETRDLEDLRDLDANILREYVTAFPDSGRDKILKAWLSSELAPFAQPKDETEGDSPPTPLTPEDRLLLMTDGLSISEQSPFAYRLVSDYYLHLEEHESAVDTSRAGLKAAVSEGNRLGMRMQNTKDALNSVLATALVHFQAPRNHAEAKRLFEDILGRKQNSTPALIGLGLIFEENEDYGDAISFLSRALDADKTNVRVGTELAWCRALNGDYVEAKQDLKAYLPQMKADDPRARDLRAQVLYRIGICLWEMDTSKSARKNREGAYSQFLAAIKTNVNFAPAYTSLGIYYVDYARDKKRGRQCFQKAFELSPSETYAAERLARSFADQGDWDIVEVISQRVIDTGRARPPPGSKRKGLSWPCSALGVVLMNKQEYQQAITSFLAALRINPNDYQSYIGLGESYHNSGRYNSALRTFTYALEPHDGVEMRGADEKWFARYMLANVHRELGEYDEAIAALEGVLAERPDEFGVLMSLLQTFVEMSWRCVETGLFGRATSSACQAISTAAQVATSRPKAFNMWKAVGDVCLTFSWVQSSCDSLPTTELQKLLAQDADAAAYEQLSDVDQISLDSVQSGLDNEERGSMTAVLSGILAFKQAIHSCSHDIHAQAVAWYNLGLAEQRAFTCADAKAGRKYLRAAVRCFKRAIELEAGNAEFWNALGVATTTLNPKVAQHSFVRSLHLNELNAKVWANLGVMYLLHGDYQLAHQSFGRSQSTDPDYAHAWVGEGLIAMLEGKNQDALSHFTHAFEISDSTSVITKRQYASSLFDHLLATPAASDDLTALVQPIFALQQLQRQSAQDLPFQHLAALYFERVGNNSAAIEALVSLCTAAEADYEASESDAALARFALAKSDLARNQLAHQDFDEAATNAETSLDLSSDPDSSGLGAAARTRLRLSAHLTAGLALYHLNRMAEAIAMFKTALEESVNDPDVVCSLVKVLWAQGGADEKGVAREQLFECVERCPDHVGAVTLLGALAALEDDADIAIAVKDDLVSLRTKEGLGMADGGEIEKLLNALAVLLPSTFAGGGEASSDDAALAETQAAVMLSPDTPQAWQQLAEQSSDPEAQQYASSMALKTAQKAVPPSGPLEPHNLAKAYAGVGTAGDAQRAVMLAPWSNEGWAAAADALEGH
ncbi:Superkiller protein 3 [Saxophila tyrrhenica]|uniref:Superkiller protein 3 n=1 Tax=Saxophila tyrrhenica TaxID=1690608 RepID=A0AAV9PIS2_9PEZI|nr:Superkiller protein 3 [Saxophila tyrrhenica]